MKTSDKDYWKKIFYQKQIAQKEYLEILRRMPPQFAVNAILKGLNLDNNKIRRAVRDAADVMYYLDFEQKSDSGLDAINTKLAKLLQDIRKSK